MVTKQRSSNTLKTIIIIGVSLSELHIDGDVRPMSRGNLYVCVYACMYVSVASISQEYAYSHVAHVLSKWQRH